MICQGLPPMIDYILMEMQGCLTLQEQGILQIALAYRKPDRCWYVVCPTLVIVYANSSSATYLRTAETETFLSLKYSTTLSLFS